MAWITPKLDWQWITPKLDWQPNDYYNFEDLNRVENNTGYIMGIMALLGIQIDELEIDADRDMTTIELASSLNRVEGNINALGQRYTPPGWQVPKLDWAANTPFSYQDAARLEINLALLHFYYQGNLDAIPYCGMLYCGEEAV